MFVANTTEGRLCTLDFTHEVLRKLRQRVRFTCPCCQEPVVLKVGTKKRPHFAHQQARCNGQFSEGETAAHASGKALLYTFFQQQTSKVELEPYLQQLQQRPDLLVDTYAVEFQCSALSLDRLYERTNGYRNAGYKPLWIPYARHKRAGWQLVTLTQFEQRCLQAHRGLAYCVTFSPEEQAFVYYNYCMQMSATMFYTQIVRIGVNEQRFPFYVPRIIQKEAFFHLCKQQQHMRLRRLTQRLRFSQGGVQDTILRLAYERYGSLLNVPIYVGIYVPNAFTLPLPPIDWQLYYIVWQQMYGKSFPEAEASFCAFSGMPLLTNAQRQAVMCYAAIVEEAPTDEHALFLQMYDKIVANSAQN